MTNLERAKDIWRGYAVHCSSVKLQGTIETALDEAERRGLERAAALVECYRHRCDEADELATAIRALAP